MKFAISLAFLFGSVALADAHRHQLTYEGNNFTYSEDTSDPWADSSEFCEVEYEY